MHIPLHQIWQSNLLEEYGSDKHVWQALDELFEIWPHITAWAAIILCAVYAMATGGGQYAVEAIIVAIAHLAIRALSNLLYRRRAPGDSICRWIRIFSACALTSGLGWGLTLALLLVHAPIDSRYLILTVAAVIMQSANSRAHMAPRPLIIQTALLLTCICVASIINGDWILLPATLLFFVFQIGHMRNLIRLRLRQLRAEIGQEQALAQLELSNTELLNANETLRQYALTDGLTGLPNRRAFDMHFAARHKEHQQHAAPLSLILFDIDHFKHFNDSFGHQAGDACLASVGETLRALPLSQDRMIARYGGEEFVMVLPKTDEASAVEMAEILRRAIASLRLKGAQANTGITVSLGVVTLAPRDQAREGELIDRADQALYLAKQKGRNRIEIFRDCADRKALDMQHP
ncbi:GGDEF domain-containing protein [Rhizobium sp. FY34]|uniref:GGDEF domain-containing protein n=1 Tax=Rhizobium sp. FY34 TaxID=2562309 RepID=UPI0010C02D5C|nr:GGDEF domain-containing protein [Rhizobium sp. FY34]